MTRHKSVGKQLHALTLPTRNNADTRATRAAVTEQGSFRFMLEQGVSNNGVNLDCPGFACDVARAAAVSVCEAGTPLSNM